MSTAPIVDHYTTFVAVPRRLFNPHHLVYIVRCSCGFRTEVRGLALAESLRAKHERGNT